MAGNTMTDMDWADEAAKNVDIQMMASWNVAAIAAALRKAKADGEEIGELRGRANGMEAAWKIVMTAESTMQAEDAIRAIIDDGANFDEVLAKLSSTD